MAFDPSMLRHDYGDPEREANACRTNCALFDFSFVGRARLEGPAALDAIAQLTRRPLTDLMPGQIRYALRADSSGRLLSDLTLWKHGEVRYDVMSGRSEDIADLIGAARPGCEVEDLSARTSIIALQGPHSLQALVGLTDTGVLARLGYFAFAPVVIADVPCLVGRLGYTGEPGFEILLPSTAAPQLWALLARRAPPAGFAAADMLRIEAGFVLFANEFCLAVTAREAGLERFAGACAATKAPDIALVCFQADTREKPVLWRPRTPPARPTRSGTITITSACHSLQAGGTLGLGYALRSDLAVGRPLYDPAGAFADIRLAPLPFFDRDKRRPRAPWVAPAQGR
jgi:glycine cleavage system aminomethyltransferase T